MDKRNYFLHIRQLWRKNVIAFLAILCSFSLSSIAFSQTNLSGEFQNYNAFQTTGDNELLTGRSTLQLGLNSSFDFGQFRAELELLDRYSQNSSAEILLREAYFDFYGNTTDFRIGKQKIILGVSNGGFVTDIISPVDLREFLTRDPSELRVGVTALSATRYFGSNYLQFILAPSIQPDLLPDQDSVWFPVQEFQNVIPINFPGPDPQRDLKNIQLALNYSLNSISDLNVNFLLYHWAHPMPAFALEFVPPNFFELPAVQLRETYETSLMAGYSLTWQISQSWQLSNEFLFAKDRLFTFLPVAVSRLEDALEDPLEALNVLQEFEIRDDGYLLSKPWLHQMIGLQTSVKNTTIGVQGFLEIILNYEDKILPQQYFPYMVSYAQRSFLRERLQLIALNRYNFFGDDFWVQFQGIYDLRDNLELALGTNLFGGDQVSPFYGHFTFHQFRENSFLFSRIAVYF